MSLQQKPEKISFELTGSRFPLNLICVASMHFIGGFEDRVLQKDQRAVLHGLLLVCESCL